MKKVIFLVLLFTGLYVYSNTDKDSLSAVENNNKITIVKTKKFPSLNKYINNSPIIKRDLFDAEFRKANYKMDSVATGMQDQAIDLFKILDETTGGYLTKIKLKEPTILPVGTQKTVGNSVYSLGLLSLELHGDEYSATFFIRISSPKLNANGQQKELYLGATDIRIDHKGNFIGEPKLTLLSDVAIPFSGDKNLLILKGGLDKKTGAITEKTYASFDCNGFKELHIEADILFSRETIIPVGDDFEVKPKDRVVTNFSLTVSSMDDIIVGISMPKFSVPGLDDTIFEVNTLVFDFSNTRNLTAPSEFPPNYEEFLVPGNPAAWTGISIKNIKIYLPKHFKNRTNKDRIFFEGKNMIIDNAGVSGEFSGNNILPLKDGAAGKWQFSVNSMYINIRANEITGAGFGGAIILPISKEVTTTLDKDTEIGTKDKISFDFDEEHKKFEILISKKYPQALVYKAMMDLDSKEYSLLVSPMGELEFPAFSGKLTIASNSYIELKVVKSKFEGKAVLSGSFDVDARIGKKAPTKEEKEKKKATIGSAEKVFI